VGIRRGSTMKKEGLEILEEIMEYIKSIDGLEAEIKKVDNIGTYDLVNIEIQIPQEEGDCNE